MKRISRIWYLEKIDVVCYSGYRLNESPRAFTFKGERFTVQEIVDRWYEGNLESAEPIIDYFRVRVENGGDYIIRYDSHKDEWTIVVQSSKRT